MPNHKKGRRRSHKSKHSRNRQNQPTAQVSTQPPQPPEPPAISEPQPGPSGRSRRRRRADARARAQARLLLESSESDVSYPSTGDSIYDEYEAELNDYLQHLEEYVHMLEEESEETIDSLSSLLDAIEWSSDEDKKEDKVSPTNGSPKLSPTKASTSSLPTKVSASTSPMKLSETTSPSSKSTNTSPAKKSAKTSPLIPFAASPKLSPTESGPSTTNVLELSGDVNSRIKASNVQEIKNIIKDSANTIKEALANSPRTKDATPSDSSPKIQPTKKKKKSKPKKPNQNEVPLPEQPPSDSMALVPYKPIDPTPSTSKVVEIPEENKIQNSENKSQKRKGKKKKEQAVSKMVVEETSAVGNLTAEEIELLNSALNRPTIQYPNQEKPEQPKADDPQQQISKSSLRQFFAPQLQTIFEEIPVAKPLGSPRSDKPKLVIVVGDDEVKKIIALNPESPSDIQLPQSLLSPRSSQSPSSQRAKKINKIEPIIQHESASDKELKAAKSVEQIQIKEKKQDKDPPKLNGKPTAKEPPKLNGKPTVKEPPKLNGKPTAKEPPKLNDKPTVKEPPKLNDKPTEKEPPKLNGKPTEKDKVVSIKKLNTSLSDNEKAKSEIKDKSLPTKKDKEMSPRKEEIIIVSREYRRSGQKKKNEPVEKGKGKSIQDKPIPEKPFSPAKQKDQTVISKIISPRKEIIIAEQPKPPIKHTTKIYEATRTVNTKPISPRSVERSERGSFRDSVSERGSFRDNVSERGSFRDNVSDTRSQHSDWSNRSKKSSPNLTPTRSRLQINGKDSPSRKPKQSPLKLRKTVLRDEQIPSTSGLQKQQRKPIDRSKPSKYYRPPEKMERFNITEPTVFRKERKEKPRKVENVTEVSEVTEITKVAEVVEVTDDAKVTEGTKAIELSQVPEVSKVIEIPEAIEVSKVTGIPVATEMTEYTEVIDVADVIEVPEQIQYIKPPIEESPTGEIGQGDEQQHYSPDRESLPASIEEVTVECGDGGQFGIVQIQQENRLAGLNIDAQQPDVYHLPESHPIDHSTFEHATPQRPRIFYDNSRRRIDYNAARRFNLVNRRRAGYFTQDRLSGPRFPLIRPFVQYPIHVRRNVQLPVMMPRYEVPQHVVYPRYNVYPSVVVQRPQNEPLLGNQPINQPQPQVNHVQNPIYDNDDETNEETPSSYYEEPPEQQQPQVFERNVGHEPMKQIPDVPPGFHFPPPEARFQPPVEQCEPPPIHQVIHQELPPMNQPGPSRQEPESSRFQQEGPPPFFSPDDVGHNHHAFERQSTRPIQYAVPPEIAQQANSNVIPFHIRPTAFLLPASPSQDVPIINYPSPNEQRIRLATHNATICYVNNNFTPIFVCTISHLPLHEQRKLVCDRIYQLLNVSYLANMRRIMANLQSLSLDDMLFYYHNIPALIMKVEDILKN